MQLIPGARRLAVVVLILTAAGASPAAAQTGEQDSDLAGVKTHIAYLRQYGGALYLGVAFTNTTGKPVRGTDALFFDHVT